MCNPISFEPIKFNTDVKIPSVLDEGVWEKVWENMQQISFTIPKIPDFPMPSITLPELKPLPPLIMGQPIYWPSSISVTVPDVPKISINIPFGEPPKISCVCLIRDPGVTDQQWLDAKARVGMHISTEEKCQAILQHIVGPMIDEPFDKFIDGLYESLQKERADLQNE